MAGKFLAVAVIGIIASLFFGAEACAEQSISAKNLYVVLMQAERESPDKTIRAEDKQFPVRESVAKVECVIAISEEEAQRRAMEKLKRQYLWENGWYNYMVKVSIVPKEIVGSLRQ